VNVVEEPKKAVKILLPFLIITPNLTLAENIVVSVWRAVNGETIPKNPTSALVAKIKI
jgi:hypothetical protein